MNAHNSFDQPNAVSPSEFKAFKTTANGFVASLPAKSVVVVEVE
jgi:alpha-L-arabinofuranosidase